MLTEKPVRARRFLNAGLAVIGFVLVCAGLRAVLPFPEVGNVASHLRFFKKHRNEFDTLFIGSSQIHHDISPAIFDGVMRDRGHPTHSFNLGINGMLVGESSYILERALATKPSHLKWVFIELDELEMRSFAGAEGSRRDVYWRDSKRTWLLLRKLFETDRDTHSLVSNAEHPQIAAQPIRAHEMGELLFFHLSLFGKNITNVSRHIDLAWWSTHFWKPEKMPTDLGPDGDGYTPLGRSMSDEKMGVYQYELDRALARSGEKYVSAATEEAYRQMAAQVRKAGATPVFLGMPLISQGRLRFREADLGTVMSFNDAKSYPQLYRREVRAEDIHLNPAGAEELSRLIAQGLSQMIDENRIR